MIFTKIKISAYFITIGDITDSTVMHIECVRCHAIKVKSKTMQWIMSRNCDIIDDK